MIVNNPNQKTIYKLLKKKCDCLIDMDTVDIFSRFDYICKIQRIVIELKCRNIKYKQYLTVMIDHAKIKYLNKFINNEYRSYLFFHFLDGLYYCCMNDNDFNYTIQWSTRYNKKIVYINMNILKLYEEYENNE